MKKKFKFLSPNNFFYNSMICCDDFYLSNINLLSNQTTIINDGAIVFDASNLKTYFLKNIYSYNCEEDEDTNACLSAFLANDKNGIIDILLERADKEDFDFFIKFVSCFLFCEKEYDSDIVHFLIRYCINSSNVFLQRNGINLLSLFKNKDSYLVDEFRGHRFQNKYLSNIFNKVLTDENFC